MGQITNEEPKVKLIPTNSDPFKAERLRKEWLYGKGINSIVGYIDRVWHTIRSLTKRLDELEDRVAKLDGKASPRHIYRAPNVTEYHIKEFVKDDE